MEQVVSESKFNIGEIPEILIEYLTESISYIKAESIPRAQAVLRKTEELLEAVVTQGGTSDPDIILVTLHNTALCYHKLAQYEQCSSYLDGCVFNAKLKQAMAEKESKLKPTDKSAYRLRKFRYLCRASLQHCAILSLLNKHEAAISKARAACKFAHKFTHETFKACADYAKVYGKSKIEHSKESTQLNELILQRWELFEYLSGKTSERVYRRSGKLPKLDMRSVLGVNHHNDWSYSYSIGDIMMIEPLSLLDIKTPPVFKAELTKDLVFEKICLLIASYFCIATEAKFIGEMDKENKIYFKKAFNLAQKLLPNESAFLTHIKTSYYRGIGKKKQFKNTQSKLRATSVKPRKTARKKPEIKQEVVEVTDKIVHSSTSEPFLPKQKRKRNSSSFDSDYFRKNFVITSDDLYGNVSDDDVKENDALDSTGGRSESKHDYMPLSIDKKDPVRVESSTGGNNFY